MWFGENWKKNTVERPFLRGWLILHTASKLEFHRCYSLIILCGYTKLLSDNNFKCKVHAHNRLHHFRTEHSIANICTQSDILYTNNYL